MPWGRGGTLPGPAGGGGYPGMVPSRGQVRMGGYLGMVLPPPGQDRGGTQLGQQKEYSLHGGRYASCVHAGGLSRLQVCFDLPGGAVSQVHPVYPEGHKHMAPYPPSLT